MKSRPVGLIKHPLKSAWSHWLQQEFCAWVMSRVKCDHNSLLHSAPWHRAQYPFPKFLSPQCEGGCEESEVRTRTPPVIALLVLFLGSLARLSAEEGPVAHPVTSLGPTSTCGGAAAPHAPGLPLPIHWREEKRRETAWNIPNVICNGRRQLPKASTGR